MPPRKQVVEDYAKRIRDAGRIDVVAKSATSGVQKSALVRDEVAKAVQLVLSDVETLVKELGSIPLTAEERTDFVSDIEADLGVARGTLSTIRKGSIAGAVAYENSLAALLQKVTFAK